MGDIIRPDFTRGNKPKEGLDKERARTLDDKKKDSIGTEELTESQIYAKFLDYFISRKAEPLLRLSASRFSLDKSRELVRGYTNQELLGWMLNSTEDDWQKRAGFFQAVWGELRKRMKL